MADIFNQKIVCEKCGVEMKKIDVEKNGFKMRAVECPSCGERIIHPKDLKEYEDFMKLRKKRFQVKLRFVGNSYAVSIPKEIIDFMNMEKIIKKNMNEMVNLCLEELGRISLEFR